MATIAPAGSSISIPRTSDSRAKQASVVATWRPRRVSREAGRAIETLGHAIDYLADEFALECMSVGQSASNGANPHIAAIELLKACNREVYFSCPELPTLSERLRRKLQSILGLQRA